MYVVGVIKVYKCGNRVEVFVIYKNVVTHTQTIQSFMSTSSLYILHINTSISKRKQRSQDDNNEPTVLYLMQYSQ